jgi:hypothetical protein
MQIEEIDRHHPAALTIEDRPSPNDDTAGVRGALANEASTGLGLDISTLDLSGSDEISVSPIGEVPGPRTSSGTDRRFSAGNRAFEEQALAVSGPCSTR